MKILWMTDLHLVTAGSHFPAGVDPNARFEACLESALEFHADADLLVITGDLIQLGNHGAYRQLRERLIRLPMPHRLVLGNHDDRQAYFAAFPEAEAWRGFAQSAEHRDGLRLIYLDSLAADGRHHGELCQDRLDWLQDVLASDPERPALIFVHHPPFEIGSPALDALKLQADERLPRILAGARILQLFCGHLHRAVAGVWNGIPVASCRSPHVQYAFDSRNQKLARSEERPGFGVILVEGMNVSVNFLDAAPEREIMGA